MSRLEFLIIISVLLQIYQIWRRPVIVTKFTRVRAEDPDRFIDKIRRGGE